MTNSTPFLFASIGCCGILLALLIAKALTNRKNAGKELQKITLLRKKITEALEDDAVPAFSATFNETLSQAEIITRLQRPRILAQSNIGQNIPEKYRILINLAAKGMGPEEIAGVLGISTAEAGQLVTLSSMAGCKS